ncbi:hypothetical protein [Desulfocurvibacter africanus]|uniref:Uncharacterized protein n=1 Tax=Desulfocurvibacter africanus subsp. africanus str. Walvis Bay TaxID=690850 RepID=F3YTP8_DESAF|nr:hypothetical protein [Desulfocurvibacter africanus]EGJ48429.1 hypothetical protein Desaf_0066 [Desulfocurvibacter africanus subsp. africanus str. Walvis Bay]
MTEDIREPIRLRIGPALVSEGLISVEQLRSALDMQARYPQFTLGQIVSILHKVPMEAIDEVKVRRMVMPQFEPVLRLRLELLERRDRYQRGLIASGFVTATTSNPVRYETKTVESHLYDRSGGDEVQKVYSRYVTTELLVAVALRTRGGEIRGMVQAEHNSQTRQLVISDSDDRLSSTLYYDLKALYLRTVGG